ncbi:fumarylacetoacetate hydrolase family protein, partial [Enterobacter hormaechei]|nr:fumarylacetoacetate hydrolase family protein [Enterobacter hormaechei]
MRYARIHYQGQDLDVTVDEQENVFLPDGNTVGAEAILWLPPASGTLFALGLNYADHATELEFKPPEEPLVFIKAANSLTGHRQVSVRPDHVEYMHYEAELVVVMGKTAHKVSRDKA